MEYLKFILDILQLDGVEAFGIGIILAFALVLFGYLVLEIFFPHNGYD